MGILIDFLQLLESGMRVDLRRRQTLMPEQLLHTFQSCLMIEHRRGERVAENMRRALLQRRHSR